MSGQVEAQIRVFIDHRHRVTGIVGGDAGLSADHGVVDLVHNILLHKGLLLGELISTDLQDLGVSGIHIVAVHSLHDGEGIPGIVKHQNVILIFFVPQKLPTGQVFFIYNILVINDTHSTPGVRNRVLVFRIEGLVLELLVNILIIGNIVEVQLFQHILFHQPGDHIVRRNDHIDLVTAASQLGVHDFVGVVGHIVDPDVGILGFKFLDEIPASVVTPCHILSPVVHIQGDGIPVADDHIHNAVAATAQHSQHQNGGAYAAHHLPGLADGLYLLGLLLFAPGFDHIHSDHQHQDKKEQQGKHGIQLRLQRLFYIGVDFHRQRDEVTAGYEVTDHEVIQAHGKGHNGACHDAGGNLGEGDLVEGLPGSASQVHSCIRKRGIHLPQLGHNIQDHIGQVKGQVGKKQCPEAQSISFAQQSYAHKDKQQGKGHAGHNIRVCHRDIGKAHNSLPHFGTQLANAHGSQGAEYSCSKAGNNGDDQRVSKQLQQSFILEKLPIAVEGEAVEPDHTFAGVKGSHHQHQHRQVQEEEDQDSDPFGRLFHATTPPSSSEPKRLMIPVQTSTRSISTRLRAEPKLGF